VSEDLIDLTLSLDELTAMWGPKYERFIGIEDGEFAELIDWRGEKVAVWRFAEGGEALLVWPDGQSFDGRECAPGPRFVRRQPPAPPLRFELWDVGAEKDGTRWLIFRDSGSDLEVRSLNGAVRFFAVSRDGKPISDDSPTLVRRVGKLVLQEDDGVFRNQTFENCKLLNCEIRDSRIERSENIWPAPPEMARAEAVADKVVQGVAELPDRTSPDYWPEAMLVTKGELRTIVMGAIDAARPEPLVQYGSAPPVQHASDCAAHDDPCDCKKSSAEVAEMIAWCENEADVPRRDMGVKSAKYRRIAALLRRLSGEEDR
jgi:hypothetical protein